MNRAGAIGECHIEEYKSNGVCVRCRGGYGHGPRVQVYDCAKGDYVTLEEDLCTARWASTGRHHIQGEVCGEPATEKIGDFCVCDYHHERMLDWRLRKTLEELRAVHAEQLRLDKERIHAQEFERARFSFVYYVLRESDGMIKIGTTRRPSSRFGTLKTEHGALRMLATHGGERQQEDDMHHKFRAFLVEGTREWFRPEPRLLRHVLRVRIRHEVYAKSLLPIVEVDEIRAMVRAAARKLKAA